MVLNYFRYVFHLFSSFLTFVLMRQRILITFFVFILVYLVTKTDGAKNRKGKRKKALPMRHVSTQMIKGIGKKPKQNPKLQRYIAHGNKFPYSKFLQRTHLVKSSQLPHPTACGVTVCRSPRLFSFYLALNRIECKV